MRLPSVVLRVALAVAASACATRGPAAPAAGATAEARVSLSGAELDAAIAKVDAAIAREQTRLEALIAEPATDERPELSHLPELREIAQRLPVLQHRLRALRAERARRSEP